MSTKTAALSDECMSVIMQLRQEAEMLLLVASTTQPHTKLPHLGSMSCQHDLKASAYIISDDAECRKIQPVFAIKISGPVKSRER